MRNSSQSGLLHKHLWRDQNIIEEFDANWTSLVSTSIEFLYWKHTLDSMFCAASDLSKHDLPFEGSENNHAEFNYDSQ